MEIFIVLCTSAFFLVLWFIGNFCIFKNKNIGRPFTHMRILQKKSETTEVIGTNWKSMSRSTQKLNSATVFVRAVQKNCIPI